MKITAILAAAGKSVRCRGKNKLFENIAGETVLRRAARNFLLCPEISEIIIAAAGGYIDKIKELFAGEEKPVKVICGGAARADSVFSALIAAEGADIVLIHDGARPFVTAEMIDECIECVKQYGSAVPALPVSDTVKRAQDGYLTQSVDRDGLYAVQTPQGFYYKDILKAYKSIESGETFTDDSSVYAKFIAPPKLYKGNARNLKITYAEDLMNNCENSYRCGTGYDSHRFESGRKFILGGVEIPFDKGLSGHSDADALCHAVCDALLSAAGLSDIGSYFPDTDLKYRGANSIDLLKECRRAAEEKGCSVCNVSAVINCQQPRLSPYIGKMKENLASALNINADDIGISAKTNEGMGFTGRGEGVFVIANCLLKSR
jgi:2-C-methyl-D-erythritol 4-phosphate cytidylyltransferase/2-C-methyl-D-erythritol 2,4-cyclodiphosphate synthase